MNYISNMDAAKMALIPGWIENADIIPQDDSHFYYVVVAELIMSHRSKVYAGIASVAFGALGLAMRSSPGFYGTVSILGVGYTLLSAKKLHDYTSHLQQIVNSRQA